MASVPPVVNNAWLTEADYNGPFPSVPTEIYSGPVEGDYAGGPEEISGRAPQGGQPGSPLAGDDAVSAVPTGEGEFAEFPPNGHAAPIASFDSNWQPWMGSGPIADTHVIDTGGVERHSEVIVPQQHGTRTTLTLPTNNRQAQVTDTRGFNILAPNDREQRDEYQDDGSRGVFPVGVQTGPYSERPLYANLAAEAMPVTTAASAYVAPGGLSTSDQRTSGGNVAYDSPPDPAVQTSIDQAPDDGSDAVGWL